MKNNVISKSSFIRGKQCLKSLYLSKKHPELRDKISEEQQALFNHGHKVGELAQKLFPGGVMAAFNLPEGFMQSINKTKELIERGESIIYEAGFMFENTHCFVDILVKENEKWNMYEVKSSGSITDVYLYDAAFQYYVLRNHGLALKEVYLVYVNKNYKKEIKYDIKQQFITESVLTRIQDLQGYVATQLILETETLQQTEIPTIKTGVHCQKPYNCDFMGYCWNKNNDSNLINPINFK
jgi:hypothetical protein